MNQDMSKQWQSFGNIVQREEGWSLERVKKRLEFLLNGFDISNKRVLDVGCGSGTFALSLSCLGAGYVVGIDPERAGSTRGTKRIMADRVNELGLVNCEFMPVGFGEHHFKDSSFDLILSYNSINHLHEVKSDLRKDSNAYSTCQKIFREFFRITAPKGMVIISDCSRKNLFSMLNKFGIPNPMAGTRTIEWEKHQVPSVWKELLQEAGFSLVSQSWYVPTPFRHIRCFIDNCIFNFCTFSHFTLRYLRNE
jgi:ubiquinone/menaquinone biosynthesis C-methylase UbiE